MRVVTLTNEKGGVGKTTVALHLAAGLALRDMRVLLIDSDSQAHCGQQLGMPERGGLYRLLVQEAEWKEVLQEPDMSAWAGPQGHIGRLLLLPSNIETRVIPLMINNPLLLAQRLEELRGVVDVVVIDTSPTPSLLQSVVYCASDAVLYPTKCEMLALDGLAKSTVHLLDQNKARALYGLPAVRLLGVLPTMYQDTNAHRYGIELIEQHFGDSATWRPIAMRTIWRDREYVKKTMYAYAPEHEATAEIDAVVERVARYVSA